MCICLFICTYLYTTYSFLLNFWSKDILMGGSGNLDKLACPTLIVLSLVWGFGENPGRLGGLRGGVLDQGPP